jgi:Ca-activated chloride channel homolog
MIGFQFEYNNAGKPSKSIFDRLLDIFKELLIHTSGDVSESLSWLNEIDKQYKITNEEYGMADFIQELIDKGYIESNTKRGPLGFNPTSKMETQLRRHALDDIFDQVKKSKSGQHNTKITGQGDESTSEIKPYEFGDKLDNIAMTETIKNAHINHGIEQFSISQDDIAVYEKYEQSQTSTVLMIDISHSMILYGEDRITPAKKVAMALSELIITKYPKDTLDIIVFGDDAWSIEIKDLPYLQVGPYHTNTVAGVELALDILKRRKNPNKQIMMITDGKPTCIKKGKKYYKNSMGLDRTIFTRTMSLAVKCKKLNIPITTFMIARDPYLVQFVDKFTAANGGKAFYSSLQGLGEFIFMDYKDSKRKRK